MTALPRALFQSLFAGLFLLTKKGFDSKYGARPLKREIQTRIEDSLAEEILSGRAQRGDHVTVTVKDDKITFLVRKYEAKA